MQAAEVVHLRHENSLVPDCLAGLTDGCRVAGHPAKVIGGAVYATAVSLLRLLSLRRNKQASHGLRRALDLHFAAS